MTDILHMVKVHASADRVYEALTDEEKLAGWWTNNVKAQSKVGSTSKFRFGNKGGADMKVVELKKNKVVRWRCVSSLGEREWKGTEVIFELQADKAGTIVRFSHKRWKKSSDLLRFSSAKWAVYLVSLKNFVEVGKGSPWPHDIQTW